MAPLPADIPFFPPRRVVVLGGPIRVVLQSRIHRRMAHRHERSERELHLARAAREPASHRLARRHAAAQLERIAHRVARGREPGAQLDAIAGSADPRPELGEQPAHGGFDSAAQVGRVCGLEGEDHVGLLERPGQRRRVRDDAGRDEVFHVRRRPVVQGDVGRRGLCVERCGAE